MGKGGNEAMQGFRRRDGWCAVVLAVALFGCGGGNGGGDAGGDDGSGRDTADAPPPTSRVGMPPR